MPGLNSPKKKNLTKEQIEKIIADITKWLVHEIWRARGVDIRLLARSSVEDVGWMLRTKAQDLGLSLSLSEDPELWVTKSEIRNIDVEEWLRGELSIEKIMWMQRHGAKMLRKLFGLDKREKEVREERAPASRLSRDRVRWLIESVCRELQPLLSALSSQVSEYRYAVQGLKELEVPEDVRILLDMLSKLVGEVQGSATKLGSLLSTECARLWRALEETKRRRLRAEIEAPPGYNECTPCRWFTDPEHRPNINEIQDLVDELLDEWGQATALAMNPALAEYMPQSLRLLQHIAAGILFDSLTYTPWSPEPLEKLSDDNLLEVVVDAILGVGEGHRMYLESMAGLLRYLARRRREPELEVLSYFCYALSLLPSANVVEAMDWIAKHTDDVVEALKIARDTIIEKHRSW